MAYDAVPDAALKVFSGAEAVSAFLSGMPPFVAPEVRAITTLSMIRSFSSWIMFGQVRSLMFAPRCGWMNAQQMGSALLSQAPR